MSRYYFDLRDTHGFHRDDFGDDFATPEAAQRQAQVLLYYVMREEPPAGDLHTVACDVRDETGRIVYGVELTCRETWGPA